MWVCFCEATWLWVENPGKQKHGPKPAVPWWLNFDPRHREANPRFWGSQPKHPQMGVHICTANLAREIWGRRTLKPPFFQGWEMYKSQSSSSPFKGQFRIAQAGTSLTYMTHDSTDSLGELQNGAFWTR